jgi:hypothetical protein
VEDGAGFACSYRALPAFAKTNFIAINSAQWAGGAACGRCARVRCVDAFCTKEGREVLAQVVDLCPECSEGDVDLSIPAYKAVTGRWPHRLAFEWEWASCAEEVEGPITFTPKGDEKNAFWQASRTHSRKGKMQIHNQPNQPTNQPPLTARLKSQAFYLANEKFPIKKVWLNGVALERSQFNFWVHSFPAPGPGAALELEADNGARLKAALADIWAPQSLGGNFE